MDYLAPHILVSTWVSSYFIPLFCAIQSYRSGSWSPIGNYCKFILLFKFVINYCWADTWHNRNHYRNMCNYYYYYPEQNKTFVTKMPLNSKAIMPVFPHGIFTTGAGLAGGWFASKNLTKLVAAALVNVPIFGDWCYKVGFRSASKSIMTEEMKTSQNLMIIAGGFNELFMTTPYEYNIFVPTGFIAMSIKYGYTIYPILSLGENEIYSALTPPKWMWKTLFKLTRILPIPFMIPYNFHRVPLIPYHGDNIQCMVGDDVDEIQQRVINSLQAIFDNNIAQYCKYRNELGIKPTVEPSMYSITFYGGKDKKL